MRVGGKVSARFSFITFVLFFFYVMFSKDYFGLGLGTPAAVDDSHGAAFYRAFEMRKWCATLLLINKAERSIVMSILDLAWQPISPHLYISWSSDFAELLIESENGQEFNLLVGFGTRFVQLLCTKHCRV